MIINNVGYNHEHDADFIIERPNGYGDNLLLLLKTASVFNINGEDVIVPENSLFIYRKGSPQYYRCLPQHTFSNDWIHFDFENNEEEWFLSYGIPYEKPIKIENPYFISFCIKSIAYETYSHNKNRSENIISYMSLIFSKAEESLYSEPQIIKDNKYEMLCTIRNKIYCRPYESRTAYSAAHEVRMSKSSFQHTYKKQFGTTFIQDMIESRISYAKMLLTSTNINIADVALQSGYNSYEHFVRQFKKYTGITPSEYRNNFENIKKR